MVATLEPPPLVRHSPSSNGAAAVGSPRSSLVASTQRFNIGRDALNKAVAELPASQRDSMEWFWRYCSERNLGRDRLGKLLEKSNGQFYSPDSIYQALSGRRSEAGINLEPICLSIDLFRQKVEPATASEGFVETRLARKIWRYCEKARKLRRIGFIFGDMSIGKSHALIELAKRDANVTYTRMPTRGHLNHYLQECARKFAMGDRQTVADLRDRVIDALRSAPGEKPKQLIIDEADQCFQSIRNFLGLGTLDFIREIYDAAGCSLVLVFDHHGRDELLGGKHAKRLKRLWRRRLPRLQLPAMLSVEDLDAFAAAVGLPAATPDPIKIRATVIDEETGEESLREHIDNPARLQRYVIANDGLTVWLMLLQEAKELAEEKKKPITWGAVIKTHAEFAGQEDA